MPLFSIPDASGLAPLDFPFYQSSPLRSFGTNLPQPAPESVAHFQAAMAKPPAEPDVSSTLKDDFTPTTDVYSTDRINVPYTALPEAAPCQADTEIRIERQDIVHTTNVRQVHQTTIDVPTQVQAIAQPDPLPAIDESTVKRQDDIGGIVRMATTKVEHVDMKPTVVTPPETAPCQADAEIRIERQVIGQKTAVRQVPQTTIAVPTQVQAADVPSQVQAADVPSQVQAADVPSQVQAADVPSQVQTIDVPSQVQAADVPSQVQTIDVTRQTQTIAVPTQAQTIVQPDPLPAIDESTVKRQDDIGGTVRMATTKAEHVDTKPTVVTPPETAPYQADAEIRIERQVIGQKTDVGQVPQTTIDVPTQIQTIAQPNPLPAIDESTVKQQDDIGGTVRMATTKVEYVDTKPTVATPPETAPYQADAETRIERQDIGQKTSYKPVQQMTDDKPIQQAANDMPPTLQAAPVVVPVVPNVAPAEVADIVSIEIDPAAATAKTRELVEAAAQVADTILVTTSLVRGDGEITIQLKPTVLDGSEIRLKAKGTEIAVIIAPATPSAAHIVEQSKAMFEQTLAERLPTFQIAVSIQSVKAASKRKDSAA